MSWLSRLFKKEAPKTEEPEAYVRLDFTHSFPHVFWVSTVSYDSEAPDGFCYKMFGTRHEPDMVIELLLLRQLQDGTKRKVFHMQAPIAQFNSTDDVIRELETSANVSFERFDFSSIRSWDEFRARAIEVGWEAGHSE